MSGKQMLALVGSPRAHSTSERLAQYLANGLDAHDWQVNIQHISTAMRKPERWAELEAQFLQADVIVLVFPLYVDALPADATLALEKLALLRRTHPQRFLSIVNCGFVEASQNDVATKICRQFARECGMQWSGGLTIGGGGAIGGRPLKELGGMVAPVVNALDMIITALLAGQDVPAEAYTLTRRQVVPTWAYFCMANLGMIKGALDHHVLLRINAQPYLRAE